MKEKKTYALAFCVDCFEREELAKMSQQELYDLASVSAMANEDEADVMSLDVLSYKINEDIISLDNCWLYFVTV